MQAVSFRTLLSSLKKSNTFFFYCAWLFGLLFGVGFFFLREDMFFSLMCLVSGFQVSIVGLVNAYLLPYLLLNFLIHFRFSRLILLLTFVFASFYSVSSEFVFCFYRNAGWLAHSLLFFGMNISGFLFLGFGHKLLSGADPRSTQKHWFYWILFALVIDYSFISTLVDSLLNFE